MVWVLPLLFVFVASIFPLIISGMSNWPILLSSIYFTVHVFLERCNVKPLPKISIDQSPLYDLQPTQDSRFPGRGRTLASSQTPAYADSNLQARLLDNTSADSQSHVAAVNTREQLSDERYHGKLIIGQLGYWS